MDICNEKFSSTCSKTFFRIKINIKLTLEEHVKGLCKKASQKVSAVARISSLMRFEQRKLIANLFIISYFSHYPLVWMFHSRHLNNRIDHIHEYALKFIFQDCNSSFKKLLRKDKTKINKNVLIECQKQKSICILKDLIDRSSHWKCSVDKVFLEISQNSQENTCARASFLIKLHRNDVRHKYKKALYSTSIR